MAPLLVLHKNTKSYHGGTNVEGLSPTAQPALGREEQVVLPGKGCSGKGTLLNMVADNRVPRAPERSTHYRSNCSLVCIHDDSRFDVTPLSAFGDPFERWWCLWWVLWLRRRLRSLRLSAIFRSVLLLAVIILGHSDSSPSPLSIPRFPVTLYVSI